MASRASPDTPQRLHLSVLALDVVSYSLEFDQVQERMVTILAQLVQAALATLSTSVRAVVLPTGDGALVALEGGSAADAIGLATRLRREIDESLLRLPLRMGIHSGHAIPVTDPAGRPNYVGAVLNLSQRVMDLGDEGHLLLSRSAAEELLSDERHASFVHRLSSNPVSVKHGVELELYYYSSPSVGLDSEPTRAHRAFEVVFAQLSRRAPWEELFAAAPIIRAIDLSQPLLGTPALVDHLESILRTSDTELRLLLCDPKSPGAFIRRASPAYKAVNELETTIEYVVKILQGLRFALAPYGEHALNRLDVRLFDAMPSFAGVIAGDRAYISIYMEHLTASRGPYLELRRDARLGERSLVACLEKSFDALWQRSLSIFDPDFGEKWKAGHAALTDSLKDLSLPSYLIHEEVR